MSELNTNQTNDQEAALGDERNAGEALSDHIDALSAWSGARIEAYAASQAALLNARANSRDEGE